MTIGLFNNHAAWRETNKRINTSTPFENFPHVTRLSLVGDKINKRINTSTPFENLRVTKQLNNLTIK
jgi:hypothetical protein